VLVVTSEVPISEVVVELELLKKESDSTCLQNSRCYGNLTSADM
jgi:hypothetical protein